MARIACGIEYNGAPFNGWQRLHHAPSVQQAVEQAFSNVADHPLTVSAAGRTDAGVHASGQVIHFDTEAERSPHAWQRGAGCTLPQTISLSWVQPVAENFHARYSATRRHYRYIILQRRHAAAGLLAERVACVNQPLDVAAMHEAAQTLLGEHDFSSFRAANCQAQHPVRRLHRLEVTAHGEFIHLDIEADRFLHHMVRIITGSLIRVGCGERPASWLADLLAARDRRVGGLPLRPTVCIWCA